MSVRLSWINWLIYTGCMATNTAEECFRGHVYGKTDIENVNTDLHLYPSYRTFKSQLLQQNALGSNQPFNIYTHQPSDLMIF